MLDSLKGEWHAFRDDVPGERFRNYHERLQHKSPLARGVRVALGVVLTAAGIAMLFVPGPGLLFMVFGLAMCALVSVRVLALYDRAEVRLRAMAGAIHRWWGKLPIGQKVLVGLASLFPAAGAAWLGWKAVGVMFS